MRLKPIVPSFFNLLWLLPFLAAVFFLSFEKAVCLHLLWLVLATFFLLRWGGKSAARAMEALGEGHLLSRLLDSVHPWKRKWKMVLFWQAMILIAFSLARPVWGIKEVAVQQRGVDLMILLDTSNSMLARDVLPNRLDRAKEEIGNLLGMLRGDRVGLIAFSGAAEVACPLTLDYGAVRTLLKEINTQTIYEPGTNIGEAIRVGIESFPKEERKFQAMLLITDGENLEASGDPVKAAQKAADAGIKIHIVGIGSPQEGSLIPITEDGVETHKKDKEGNTVVTRLDVKTLEEVAKITGGEFQAVIDRNYNLGRIYQGIREQEKREFEERKRSRKTERFQYFLAPALLLLVSESLLGDRRPTSSRRHRVGQVEA
jgi:Ca-activated chloride channel family protein